MMLFSSGPLRWRRTPMELAPPPPAHERRPARAAVFVDLDGGLVEHRPCNVDPALLALQPGAAAALASLAAQGYVLLVVTNQSGLARGYFTRTQFAHLQAALEKQLLDAGVVLLDFLVCPHAPGPDGGPSCLCRMPAPGLLMRAARRHGLDLARSWMVGDSLDGIEAGRRAGCRTLLLAGGHEGAAPAAAAGTRVLRQPDLACDAWQQVPGPLMLTPQAPL